MAIRRFFCGLSALWGLVFLINATITLILLAETSTTRAVPLATATSVPAFLIAILLSYRAFRHAVHTGGFVLVWGGGEAFT